MNPWPKAIEDDPDAQDLWLCDVCECGDYRGDHAGSRHNGGCTLPSGAVHGFKPCRRFHLLTGRACVPPTALPVEFSRERVFARFARIAARG